MSKCNWCEKPTQLKYQSDFKGDIYYSFCSNRCEVEYSQAVEDGKIIPQKSTSLWKVILIICIALFIIGKCQS
jgi:endogenous inhibitor of DNA gyrase (YacG/DUF329 family)